MIRRPPRSTLFPYTSSSDLARRARAVEADRRALQRFRQDAHAGEIAERSEEHTSELQSQFHLVCRLLLEKKKKQTTINLFKNINTTSEQSTLRYNLLKPNVY